MRIFKQNILSLAIGFSVFLFSACTKNSNLTFNDETLRTLASRNPSSTDPYSISLELAPRTYVHSVIRQVFDLPESHVSTSPDQVIRENVRFKYELGGGCDRYAKSEKLDSNGGYIPEFPDDSCVGSSPSELSTQSNSGRFGRINFACNYVINAIGDTFVNNAIKKVRTDFISLVTYSYPPNELDIIKIYQLFLPNEIPPDEVIAEYMKVTNKGTTIREKWRFALYIACVNPIWQYP